MSDNMFKQKKSLITCTIWACIIGLMNLLTYTSYSISLIIVCAEYLVLFIFLLRNKYDLFYSAFLISLCMSFEFADTSGSDVVYGFKSLEIAGISVALVILLVSLAIYLCIKKTIRIDKAGSDFGFIKYVVVLGIIGTAIGLINIVFNDNGIRAFDNVYKLFVGEVYLKFAMELIVALSAYFALRSSKNSRMIITNTLVSILIGTIFTMIFSSTLNITGRYGGIDTLMVQNVIRYTPFLYIFSITEERKGVKAISFVLATIGMIYTLLFNATGKMILLYLTIPCVVIIVTWRRNRKLAIFELLGVPALCALVLALNYQRLMDSTMFYSKWNEVLSLFQFGDGWLRNMPLSPRTRIGEVLNIFIELLENPLSLLLGKGYLGTTKDHLNLITGVLGAYTSEQNSCGIFYGMHESINNLFLTGGILGIVFWLKYVGLMMKRMSKSMLCYAALFWLVFSYGFSLTLTAYGITALMVELFTADHEKRKDFYNE